MNFISYSNNFEDFILWRALKHVDKGFYIDVGAGSSDNGSVTKTFYDMGWRGINLEASKYHFEYLSVARKRDTNLLVVAGDELGQAKLYDCAITGAARIISNAVLDNFRHCLDFCYEVKVTTLKNICEQYAEKEIHFLRINVDGREERVINGINFFRCRPWIIVVAVETTDRFNAKSHYIWEQTLLSNGYIFVYSDSLNRFYLASERDSLVTILRYPPNTFSDLIKIKKYKLDEGIDKNNFMPQEAEANIKYIKQIEAIYESRSWRITAPLRWLNSKFLFLFRRGFNWALRNLLKKGLNYVNNRPALKFNCIKLAHRLKLFGLLKKLLGGVESLEVNRLNQISGLISERNIDDLLSLNPRALKIYKIIKK